METDNSRKGSYKTIEVALLARELAEQMLKRDYHDKLPNGIYDDTAEEGIYTMEAAQIIAMLYYFFLGMIEDHNPRLPEPEPKQEPEPEPPQKWFTALRAFFKL
tara:strand:- start:111 stop:422 length:312 start_codon:yes stop_codon:yes gene_type:complete